MFFAVLIHGHLATTALFVYRSQWLSGAYHDRHCLGHGLHTFTALFRLTQPSTLCGKMSINFRVE